MNIKLSKIDNIDEVRMWRDDIENIRREISRHSDPLAELLTALRVAVVKGESPKTKVTVCIEAYWSGYRSSQERCVHREYRKVTRKKAEEWKGERKVHRFTDGTNNWYAVKILPERAKREREIRGYVEITNDLFK